ncbi:MAG: class I SAM-dependent methyltransferase [Xanthomonadales bacterium]|nr:class I SAM-dependent methyltransferase [Xanthomonadales bacterium]
MNDHNINTVIEFGCGDGNQLSLINYKYYSGFDVSETIIKKCKEKFSHDKTKKFYQLQAYNGQCADLTLSLDVIYHLVEDTVYRKHLNQLFSASKNFVIIYSSNTNDQETYQSKHVRHRLFLTDIDNNQWELFNVIPNKYPYDGNEMKGSPANFFIFRKKTKL